MLKISGSTLYRQSCDHVVTKMEHRLQLSQSAGHYYHKDVDMGLEIVRKKVVSARGFELIGSICGVTFVKPPRVADENGVEVDNPIIKRSAGTVTHVRIREILMGRAENGNIRAIDLSLSYDVAAGLATQMLDAWHDNGNQPWAYLSNEIHANKEMEKSPFMGAVGIGGNNYLMYDLRSGIVRRILREHATWAMLADRTAATIVERNLMRRYLGFSEAGEDGMVSFSSWPTVDVEWDKIRWENGNIIVSGDSVSREAVVETAEDAESEEGIKKDEDVRVLIKEQVRRLGSAAKAKEIGKAVMEKHGLRWGQINTTKNQDALLALYVELRNNVPSE